jgi:hypothetical protein
MFHSHYFFASLLFLCLYTNIYIFHSFFNDLFFTDCGVFVHIYMLIFYKTINLATLKLLRRKLSKLKIKNKIK